MTYLELVQRLSRQCGEIRSIPTLVGATGLTRRYAEWIADAWHDLQNVAGWRWMRRSWTLDLAGVAEPVFLYRPDQVIDDIDNLPISRFQSWRIRGRDDPPRIRRLGGDGEAQFTSTFMSFIEWGAWKSVYQYGTPYRGYPVHISIDPQNNLAIAPSPNDGAMYRVEGDYYAGPMVFTLDEEAGEDIDNQEPDMPSQFHMLIVYDAMVHYGYQRIAQETVEEGVAYGNTIRDQLESSQSDPIQIAGPLVR